MYVADNASVVENPAENGSTVVQTDTPKKKRFGSRAKKKASASQVELKVSHEDGYHACMRVVYLRMLCELMCV